MHKFYTPDEFRREALAGRAAGAGVLVQAVGMRDVDTAKRIASFVFSNGDIDRQGDRISPQGWQLSEFRTNPIALFQHDARSLPVGRALNVRVENGALRGDIEFPSDATYPFGHQVFKMVRDGYLRAVSVGFSPVAWTWATDPSRKGGIDFLRQTLLEISCVSLPANAGALLGAGLEEADRLAKAAKRRRQIQLLRLQDGP